jgi:hypothetical protein
MNVSGTTRLQRSPRGSVSLSDIGTAMGWGSGEPLVISDVTGLQSALDGKQAAGSYAAASHTHTIAETTGLQTALDGKQAAGSYASNPTWWGNIAGAWADGDPQELLNSAVRSGTVAVTPTNLAITVARIAYFRLRAALTVNKIRFLGVGATTNVFRVALYNGDTLARLMPETAFTTAGNTWGAAGSSLNVTLAANQLYFIAVSVNATGTTAGALCFTPTQAATTGQIAVLPKNFPGNLDIDSSYIRGAFAQFTVTNGALPDPAATIATQGAWTGGFPAFFLDNSNA